MSLASFNQLNISFFLILGITLYSSDSILLISSSLYFESLKKFIISTVQNSAKKVTPFNELHLEYEWVEEFPNTQNDSTCNKIILKAAKQAGLTTEKLLFPFRWSEDFGHFLKNYPGVLFGLGAGTDQPALHNPDYDFPDELIEAGVQMFCNIYNVILK